MTELQKLPQESKDMTADNIEKLSSIFPNCITEVKDKDGNVKKSVNFDVLKQMMSSNLIEGSERYEFTWPGKNAAILEANTPIRKTLRPCVEESKDWENTQNLYIEGDNLDALKLLQESYLGKIKMIYIDPPYNTGSDKFIYPDNFEVDNDSYLDQIGAFDSDGNKLFRENLKSNPRFHSSWISMLYSRLLLCRNLLSDDGAIFIHIDEGELFNLKQITDEIFYSENFCNIITVKTKAAGVSGSYMGKSLQNNAEYILFYCKNSEKFHVRKSPYKKQEIIDFIDSYAKAGKSWKYTSVLVSTGEREFVKTIFAGNGDEIKIYRHKNVVIDSIANIAKKDFNGDIKKAYYSNINTVFRTTNAQSSIRSKIMEETKDLDSDLISIEYIPTKGKNAGTTTTVYYKDPIRNMVAFLKEVVSIESDGIYKLDQAGNLWDDINYNNLSSEAGGLSFPNGQKPIQLLERLIDISDSNDSIVMDFFSGSSSTAHAVMRYNALNNTNLKFIMVQYQERIESKKAEFKQFKTICDIGKERIRRASDKIKHDFNNFDFGFRVFSVDDSNMKDVYFNPDVLSQDILNSLESNVKADRTDLDLLFGCVLDFGLTLDKQIKEEVIDGKKILIYNDDAEVGADLIACFEDNISEELIKEIAKRKPSKAVFKDSSFANSPVKINLFEIFKLYAEIDADELPLRVRVI